MTLDSSRPRQKKFKIPETDKFDSTLDLFSNGYSFISRRCEQLGTDAFKTRLFLKSVICMTGERASEFFFHADHFTRKGGTPFNVTRLLQDFRSVNRLSGLAHRSRKALFTSFMNPDLLEQLGGQFDLEWRKRQNDWVPGTKLSLFHELNHVLTRAACTWVGLSVSDQDVRQRAKEFEAMVDDAGRLGFRHWRAHVLRSRAEKWARRIIEGVRNNKIKVVPDSPIYALAHFTEPRTQKRLKIQVAAVELINLLRPITAVSRFLVFSAIALFQNPVMGHLLTTNNGSDEKRLENFAQEVRRFYPFFPFVGGRALDDLEFEGYKIKKDDWVLMDIYGTNHDARIWGDPTVFRPERFNDQPITPFNMIAQGGGEHLRGHRCPGELITVMLLKRFTLLWKSVGGNVTVAEQNLELALDRMPARPASGFEFFYNLQRR